MMCVFTNLKNAAKYATKGFLDLNAEDIVVYLLYIFSLFLTLKYQKGYDPYLHPCLCLYIIQFY